MPQATRNIFLTGASGLLGGDVLATLLARDPALRVYVLVRDLAAWHAQAGRQSADVQRAIPVCGDLTQPGLGLAAVDRARIARDAGAVLHLAADTRFSRTLAESRAVNVRGTQEVLALADECRHLEQFLFVSTVYAAGRLSGVVAERAINGADGWVNAYEQSKHESEALVRAARRDALVVRTSTVVCCEFTGTVRQANAVHQTLRLYHRGLASMVPGAADTLVDTVPYGYVREALADLTLRTDLAGRTMHLCAGRQALQLGELLDVAYDYWSKDPAWRRRALPRPVLTDLATYQLFERTVLETGDARVAMAARALSYMVPQLAYPKCFDTTQADAALGYPAPSPPTYWLRMVEHLLAVKWATARLEVAA